MDARMVHNFSSAPLQLRRNPHRREPPPPLGPQTSRRPRQPLRVEGDTLSDTAVIPQNATEAWVLPTRGIVGMACLIVAEAAIFIIFIVAYLYYLGKSLSGPTPHDVLELPIFISICLLSSSATVHFAVSALHHAKRSMCSLWLAATI